MLTDEEYMRRALELADIAATIGEVPVGAIVVHKPSGRIIGEGYNRRETAKSALCHAEIIAINAACQTLHGWRLVDSVLYVTLEPCPMCAGACLSAHLDSIIFGASDPNGGALFSRETLFENGYNWHPTITAGILESDCRTILTNFFRALRQKPKYHP